MPFSNDFRASVQDGQYPRPQLVRPAFSDLTGEWEFDHDDSNVGLTEGWHHGDKKFGRKIQVPYPPESKLSGINDKGFHPVVWYRRKITRADLVAAGKSNDSDRLLLHFGAVDYRMFAWINGKLAGSHEGGQTSFHFDVTDHLGKGDEHYLVVRAEDDPHDISQPRGKQDWEEKPHVIWYDRTTGIWQPVWLEATPDLAFSDLRWDTDIPGATVFLSADLSKRPSEKHRVTLTLSHKGTELAMVSADINEPHVRIACPIARQFNGQGYEQILWSPEKPNLIDADITITNQNGEVVEHIKSYLGLRSVAIDKKHFLLNDRPYFVRSVLEQGFWPESHLAAPSANALREEVQLIKDLGFNTARIHQKVEDPRFLYWADSLGLMIWGEIGSTFEFSPDSIKRTTKEWMSAVNRDQSHPCIVTWVPLNESWGVQHISHNKDQQNFAKSLFHLTKTLDPSRPVISNDGWEHTESDILTIHDYTTNPNKLRANYESLTSIQRMVDEIGPAGRRLFVEDHEISDLPVMVTEFGGISYAPGSEDKTWGYSVAGTVEDFEVRLRETFDALHDSRFITGFCYTQLTDTMQEANGLVDENRKPKLPIEKLRAIVLGEGQRKLAGF
jgi:beta-galactosidase/beta-glucuronidase